MSASTTPNAPDTPAARRRRILESSLVRVEDVHGTHPAGHQPVQGFSADFQVCLPYRGFFLWHVGGDDVAGDANQVLFVKGGEPFRLSQPLGGEYAELVITPAAELLTELARAGSAPAVHPLFRRRSRRLDAYLLQLRTEVLRHARYGGASGLGAEEAVIALLCTSLDDRGPRREPAASTRRLIARTKQFLAEHLADPVRLADVARGVGASPAYLTDVFRRVEGVPLHGYLMQLRLSRALVELPHASDLASLALDVGFSSHSHFTAVFRRVFGCTPSECRAATNGRGRAVRSNPARWRSR